MYSVLGLQNAQAQTFPFFPHPELPVGPATGCFAFTAVLVALLTGHRMTPPWLAEIPATSEQPPASSGGDINMCCGLGLDHPNPAPLVVTTGLGATVRAVPL